MSAAERAYFDNDHCQHVAAFEEVQRLKAIQNRGKQFVKRFLMRR